MALEIFSAFRKYPFRFILLVALGFFLTATSTQAGFEWVPAPKQTAAPPEPANSALPAPTKAPAVPPSVVEQAPMATAPSNNTLSAPADQKLAPMPGEDAAAAAVIDAAPPAAPTQPLSAPPNMVQAPVIKTRTFTNAAEMEAPIDESVLPMPSATDTAPIADATPAPLSPSPATAAAAQAAMDAQIMTPVAAPAPIAAPKAKRSFIVMPEDAPDSARAQLPESQIAAEKAEDITIPEDAAITSAPVTARAATPSPVSEMPVIVDDSESAALPLPIGAEETLPAETAPAAPAEMASVPSPMPAPAAGDYAVVEGFGSDMPLALALREVIPEDYAYSFGAGVNPGVRVSWEGGKSWPDVVSDMVAPHGMTAALSGKVVMIRSNNMGAAMPTNNNDDSAKPAIEPASGKAESKEFSADVYSIRRQIINDPGEKAAQQPEETLDMIKELGVDDGAAQQKNAKGPQPLLPEEAMNETPAPIQADAARAMAEAQTDAQAMEASEKQALSEKSTPKIEETQEIAMVEEEDVQASDIADEAPLVETTENEIAVEQIPVQTKNTSANAVNALWEAQKGDSLKRTLDDWSKKSNYELVWESSHDYTVSSDILVTGDFQRAVRTVFAQGMEPGNSPLLTFVAKASADKPGKILIQDSTPG